MQSRWARYRRWCAVLGSGGISLGIFSAYSLVSFAQIFTQLLSSWLSALVTLLLGGDASQFFGGGNA